MTQSCDICRGDRYQRRGRGDQGQQGTEDWPDAQEGNVRSRHIIIIMPHSDFVMYCQVLKISIKHF